MENALEIILSARDEASDTIAAFGGELSNVLGIAAGFSLANVGEQFGQAAAQAIGAAEDFQAATAALGTVLGNVADGGEQAVASFAGSGSKMKDIAMQQEDEMRQYAEKVKKLNDDMAEINQGQNIIDAQASMYQQLDDLAQQHADKVASLQQQIADVTTNETNSLTDMQSSHNNKMADLAEKHAQEMGDAVSDIERKKLQKKYDEEVQYDNDSFERQYTTKKEQLDRDAAQKLKALQEEISKENDMYTQKYAVEQKKDEDNVAKLKADNDKKLAQYKQELADEEIAHTEHLQKLQEQAASGGGGGLSPKMQELPITSQFRLTKQSAEDLKGYLDQTFSKGTPFQLNDWVEFSKTMTEAGVSAEKIAPAIENIAAANNVSLSTAGQAIFQGMQGNVKGMSSTLHISAEELRKAGAEFTQVGTLKDKQSFFSALEDIGTKNYAGGLQNFSGTLKGTSQEISNDFQLMALHILGFNTVTDTIVKGGVLDEITKGLKAFGDYVQAHHTEIESFFKNLFQAIGDVARFLTSDFNPTMGTVVSLVKGMVTPVVAELFKVFHDNQPELKDIADKFKDILNQLKPLYDHLNKSFGPLIQTLTDVTFKALIKMLDSIATAFDDILKVTDKLWKLWDKVPSGIKELKGLVPFGSALPFATGTSFAPGGLSLVGENGPELVNLPRGSQVIPNNQISSYSKQQNVTIENVNVNNEMDIDTLARRLTMGLKFNSAII